MSDRTESLKALYVEMHGSTDGWLGVEGSYFISGVQAADRLRGGAVPVATVTKLPSRYGNPTVEWANGAAVRVGMRLHTAPPAPTASEEWKLVPIRMPDRMVAVMQRAKHDGWDLHGMWESLLAAAPAPAVPMVSVQTAWEWAGGNPGVKATVDELRDALVIMDEAIDAMPEHPAPADFDVAGWTWIWLMDYCKKAGVSPAHHDELFKLVGDMRAMLAAAPDASEVKP